MGFIFLSIACAAVMGGGGYFLVRAREEALIREEERRLARAGFREILTRELRRAKAAGFDFAELVDEAGIERHEADAIAREFYAKYNRKVFCSVSGQMAQRLG